VTPEDVVDVLTKAAAFDQLARVVREERRRETGRSDVLALPSRYEDDVTRDLRIQEGVTQCRDVITAIMERLAASRKP
jgi:hypothetical protein